MKKIIIIGLLILICVSIVYIYNNYNSIASFFSNKEWELTESIGTIPLNNFYCVDGTDYNLVVVGSNYIKGYLSNLKESFDESLSLKDAITNTAGDYCIIGENNGSKVYLINGASKVWKGEVQGNILNVSVNKNGYSVVIYKQTGYKSLVKVMNPTGTELFTSYLTSTYAVDAKISNDNKNLVIAEIDASGISAESSLKIIDINNLDEENIKRIDFDDNSIIIDIEYSSNNKILVLTDKNLKVVNNGEIINEIGIESNMNFFTIENSKNLVTMYKKENGLLDVNYYLSIYDLENDKNETKEYELPSLPSLIRMQNKSIAVLLENELIVLNTNGKLIKRCEMKGSIKDIVLFSGGNYAAIIFRDKIELLKI